MVEMIAEAALWVAGANLREAMDEEPQVPIWRRVLFSVALIMAVIVGVLVVAHLKDFI
jgi:undecaprenyl pyrophosphate phosphatase UppP